jgi:hypothetical protein
MKPVEKLHFKTHVGKFCKEYCNPYDHPEMLNFNTVVCEQQFKWLARYKYLSATNMSASTFNFLILLLCWLDQEQRDSPFQTVI